MISLLVLSANGSQLTTSIIQVKVKSLFYSKSVYQIEDIK